MGTECLSIFEAQSKLCVTILLELWETLNISPNHKREKIQSLTYRRRFSEYLKMLYQFAIIVEQNDLHESCNCFAFREDRKGGGFKVVRWY